jgi:hypothetical protein
MINCDSFFIVEIITSSMDITCPMKISPFSVVLALLVPYKGLSDCKLVIKEDHDLNIVFSRHNNFSSN